MIHARHLRRGFTLVELLVVIGIIALLIATLLPALNRARSASKAVACLSNVRQLATAAQMYAHDHKVYIGYQNGADRKAALFPYVRQGQNNADTSERQVWNCPANNRLDSECSYGFNTNLNFQKLVKVHRWSETVALCDGGLKDDGTSSLSTHMWPPGVAGTASSCRPNHLRHPNKTVCIGFVDGHAERRAMEAPFYPGPIGNPKIGNGITDPDDANYLDRMWALR